MYSKEFEASLKAVEAARKDNIAYEPTRMTAKEKDDLLAAYHPDYKKSEFSTLKIGPNKGETVPHELCDILQAHSRIKAEDIDLNNITYDVDVLIIGEMCIRDRDIPVIYFTELLAEALGIKEEYDAK